MDEVARVYFDYLREEGYLPKIDAEGDVIFKYEGGTYFIAVDEEDRQFFRLVFPNFWTIESEEERLKVYRAAVYTTATVKVAKVFPVGDNTWATIELFCSEPETVIPVFRRALGALQAAIRLFREKMRE